MNQPSSPADSAAHPPAILQPGNARDLLLQLYRDIGIGAVAAALGAGRSTATGKPQEKLSDPIHQSPVRHVRAA